MYRRSNVAAINTHNAHLDDAFNMFCAHRKLRLVFRFTVLRWYRYISCIHAFCVDAFYHFVWLVVPYHIWKLLNLLQILAFDISRICAIFSVRLTREPKCTVMELALDTIRNKKGPKPYACSQPAPFPRSEWEQWTNTSRSSAFYPVISQNRKLNYTRFHGCILPLNICSIIALNARVYHIVCATKRIIGFLVGWNSQR